MLETLKLNNLALSYEAEVEFTPGMICITGETGAGKSLVVDALGLVLGAKADVNMVRQGEKQLEVSAAFSIKGNHKVQSLLKEFGFAQKNNQLNLSLTAQAVNALTTAHGSSENSSESVLLSSAEPNLKELKTASYLYSSATSQEDDANNCSDDEDDELILRRVVSVEGKSRAYINGHLATVTQLRQIGEHLVAIHGQHASVRLMDEKNQLETLDNFGRLRPLLSKVNAAFNEYARKRAELTKLSDMQKQGVSVFKQDRFDLEELNRLSFKKGDYEALEAMFDKAQNQEQFSYAIGSLRALIEGNDNNLITLLRQHQLTLDKVKAYDMGIVKIMEEIEAAILHLTESCSLAEDISERPLEMSKTELERQMSKVHELSRRFSCLPSELYLMQERLEKRVSSFLGLKSRISSLTEEVKEARQVYDDLCTQLSQERRLAASKLAQKVSKKIKQLALPDAQFDIDIKSDEKARPRLNGRDDICFIFSANYGQELRPLSAVASGGELSRLALTLEVLTASVNSTPTLIFDEVDTGISGRTASAVGSLLRELGKMVQVITVTHLPQVAAKAHTQFVVSKYTQDGQVNSVINKLDEQGRIDEIARMIGGSVITETTRLSAQELINDN